MAMALIMDKRQLIPRGEYSPVLQDRINRLKRDADRLFSLGNIRMQCQQALVQFHANLKPAPFADMREQLSANKEYLFAQSLTLTYRSTNDWFLQWASGCMKEFLLQEVFEERERRIEEFALMKIASRWYQMKDDDQWWRVFSQNIPYGYAERESEINEFFETLDIVCILTDILTGHAAEYGLNVEYIKDKSGGREKELHENKVLKKNHHGKPIDFQELHKRIDASFVAEIKFGYEWLSLWRMLYDLNLLEDVTLTSFAEQMNMWYPYAKKPCSADSMGDYYSPYLGTTAFTLWTETEFMKHQTSKQSITGFRRLCNDCETIKEALRSLL